MFFGGVLHYITNIGLYILFFLISQVLFVKMFFGGVLVGLMFGKATQIVMASTNSVSNHIDGTLQIAMTFICAYLR